MRFLLINYEYPPIGAGAANATFHLAREIVAMGHQATVVTSAFGNLSGHALENGVDVFRCPSGRISATRGSLFQMACFLVSARIRLPGILRRQGRPDGSIIFFSLPCGLLGPYLKRRHKIPYGISLRGGDVPGTEHRLGWLYGLTRRLRRRILSESVAVVANSAGLAERSRAADGIEARVIPNGVDSDFFAPESNPVSRLGRIIRFVFVGRFHRQKNLVYVLDRFAELHEMTDTPFEVVFVGDGPDHRALQTHAQLREMGGYFRMEPWCDPTRLRRHYLDAHCLVNLSQYEGMPNSVLEAMACGLPIVVSEIGGHEELVNEGVNGFRIPLSRPELAVSRLLKICQEPDLRVAMGAESRKKIVAGFTWRKGAEAYVRLFKRCNRS